MINEVITTITRTLSNEFPNHDIYIDEIPQDFKKESFFVKVLAPSIVAAMDRRFTLTIPLDVHYWGDSNTERCEMIMQLYDLLDVITSKHGNKFRSFSINAEIVDDCLHFFITYKLILTRIQAEELMEVLEIKSKVEGE